MSLWGKNDLANNAPKYGAAAWGENNGTNTNVYGVSSAEKSNTSGKGPAVAHSGWVKLRLGTGGVSNVVITNGGIGYNANGFLAFSAAAGANANASYTRNAAGGIVSVTLNSP